MINLKLALENAVVDDTDTELEYPFDEIETAALAAEDGFEFQISRVVTAMESARPFSRRHREIQPAAANVALEEVSGGFWALLALAVAAAVGLIGKMLGWFEGGGSSGGGGGGGGGSAPIEKVEKKIEAVKATAERAADTIELTVNNPSILIRDVSGSPQVKAVVEAQIKGMTEFTYQCCMEKSEFGKLMEKAMGHMEVCQKNAGPMGQAVDQLSEAWAAIDAGEADGKKISMEGMAEIKRLTGIIMGTEGTKAQVDHRTLREFLHHFSSEVSGWKNSTRAFSKSDLDTHHKNLARLYSSNGGIDELFGMIEYMNKGLTELKTADAMIKEKVQPFIDREAAKAPNLADKSPGAQAANARTLLGIGRSDDHDYLAARTEAERATRTAYKEYLSWLANFLRLSGQVVSIFGDMTVVLQSGVEHTHAVLRASAEALRAEGKEVTEDLKKAIDATKPGKK